MRQFNANATLVLQFLYTLVNIFKSYFGGLFDEDAIKNNFVLIYELLDGVCVCVCLFVSVYNLLVLFFD